MIFRGLPSIYPLFFPLILSRTHAGKEPPGLLKKPSSFRVKPSVGAGHGRNNRAGFFLSGALYTCGSFSPHTRLVRKPEYRPIRKSLSGMCCFRWPTISRCVSVSVACLPVLWSCWCVPGVVCQPGLRYWRLCQIMARVFHCIFADRRHCYIPDASVASAQDYTEISGTGLAEHR